MPVGPLNTKPTVVSLCLAIVTKVRLLSGRMKRIIVTRKDCRVFLELTNKNAEPTLRIIFSDLKLILSTCLPSGNGALPDAGL